MNIFGVTISAKNRAEVLGNIRQALSDNTFHRVTTLNPEFLLLAREDNRFRENLNQADIKTIDGGGLRVVFWLQKKPWSGRVTGGEIVDLLCHEASLNLTPTLSSSQERGLPPHPSASRRTLLRQERGKCKIGIVVREDGLSSLEEILVALRKKYPSLDCNGITIPRISISARSRLDANLEIDLQKILDCAIILCSLGAPEQEYFTESLRQNPGNIRVAVGVGGVFDILTGKIKQAPRWISKVGLEWLWRLLQQPRRFRRIFRAVVVFPYTCFIYKKKL